MAARQAGSWGPKDYPNPNSTVAWASDRAVYEWQSSYTEETAPADAELEVELFGEENRINTGINFSNFNRIDVGIKGAPEGFKPMNNFNDIKFHPTVAENIVRMKYTDPTPVQKNSIPLIMANHDLLACAQTGSGKTAAFLIPVLSKLLTKLAKNPPKPAQPGARRGKASPLALIILPTRELAIQIFDEARRFTYKSRLRPAVIYGGADTKSQKEQLARGCDILIGTPGRLVDAIERGWVALSQVKSLVLDEADRILDMGFEPMVRKVVQESDLPRDESLHTSLFSATFPAAIQVLARDFLKEDYVRLRVGRIGGATTDIVQKVVKVEEYEKEETLVNLLLSQAPSRTMVFVESKRRADQLDDLLFNKDFPCISLHGDRDQKERESALEAFKSGRSPILITTAVASRGLDIKNVLHIINYDLCSDIDEYVHRIGRTARAGNPGLATTFYNDRNRDVGAQLTKILVECNQEVPECLRGFVEEEWPHDLDDFVEADHADVENTNAGGEWVGGGSNTASRGWNEGGSSAATESGAWGASAESQPLASIGWSSGGQGDGW